MCFICCNLLFIQKGVIFWCTEHAKVPDELAAKPLAPLEEEELNNGPEILNPSGNEGYVIEDKVVESTPHQIDSSFASEEDAPKKSYASIVSLYG